MKLKIGSNYLLVIIILVILVSIFIFIWVKGISDNDRYYEKEIKNLKAETIEKAIGIRLPKGVSVIRSAETDMKYLYTTISLPVDDEKSFLSSFSDERFKEQPLKYCYPNFTNWCGIVPENVEKVFIEYIKDSEVPALTIKSSVIIMKKGNNQRITYIFADKF